jgi:protein-tyrosine phosphatase
MRSELHWIEGPWSGRLAIMPRPRGGDWLEDEIASWRRLGIDVIVSTLTTEENSELDLTGEREVCEGGKIAFVSFPIEDRGTPSSRSATLELVRRLGQELSSGKKIAIYCRQGVGRSALLAACILAANGVKPASAWERIATPRGCVVPDTSEQREWVVRSITDLHVPDMND